MRLMILAGSLLLALSSSAMASPIFKWVDAQGVTHFSAQPPQGQPAETLGSLAAPRPSSRPPAEEAKPEATDQESIDRKVKQEVAAFEAERKQFCDTQRNNLAQLRNNPRIRVEEEGEVRRLNEEQRQERIAHTEKQIAENCD